MKIEENKFSRVVSERFPGCNAISGYSDRDLVDISSVYDIEIDGELRDFLVGVGRSAGVLGSKIIIHDPRKNLRKHLLSQEALREMLYSAGEYDAVRSSPFFIFAESETAFYFVRTRGGGEVPLVYEFVEGTGQLSCTNMTLIDFFHREIDMAIALDEFVCRGDLLRF